MNPTLEYEGTEDSGLVEIIYDGRLVGGIETSGIHVVVTWGNIAQNYTRRFRTWRDAKAWVRQNIDGLAEGDDLR